MCVARNIVGFAESSTTLTVYGTHVCVLYVCVSSILECTFITCVCVCVYVLGQHIAKWLGRLPGNRKVPGSIPSWATLVLLFP